jgi:hemoglobin
VFLLLRQEWLTHDCLSDVLIEQKRTKTIAHPKRMSKYDIHQKVWEQCGISYEESQRAIALEPSLFDRLGTDGIRRLSALFYEHVFNDRVAAPWFVNIFASSTKQGAIDNQYRFLVQTFGGPDLYRQVKGKYTRLVGRHAAFTTINHDAASRWMQHMTDAMKEHEVLSKDEEALNALEKYFRFTAHYIVVASEFMRPDQVRSTIGYASSVQ